MSRPPRPRPVAEAHPRRRRRTARSPGSRSTCWPTSAPTSRSSAAACRCSARSCSTRSTSSPPTSSTARRCSPTRPGPTPTAAPGGPEATYAIERLMDELAAEVGVDPLEIREKNWIKHEEFPFTTVAGLEYDSGNYEAATAQAKEMFGYDELRAEQKRRRDSGDPVQLGIGVSTFTEMCGLAPVPGAGLAQLRRRRLGARERADAGHRQGRGRHRRLRARPGPRDGVQPDRRRPARRGLRGRRGAARRHPDLPQGPRHLRLALAGRRRRGAGQGRRQGDREGQADRGPPARGLRRRPRVLRRPVHASGAPTRAWRSARSPPRSSPRTTCPTGSSRPSTRRRPTTR